MRRMWLALAACLMLAPALPAIAQSTDVGPELASAMQEGRHTGALADGRVWSVPMQRKEIALTFDDGPYPFYTPLLVHQLETAGAPATFFLVGRTMQEYPQLVERIVATGSEIANHTFNHYSLTGLTDAEIEEQITSCGTLLETYTGARPTLFRPPHGRYDTRVVDIARRLGYRTILWSDAPDDSPKDNSMLPVDVTIDRVVEQARPGGIVLLHSGQYNTIMALPEIIAQLRAQGYTFVTVSQLLGE